MAQRPDDARTARRSEDTTDPNNPPNSMINEKTRSRAFWSYVGPILALFVIVGIVLIYWLSRGPVQQPNTERRQGQPIGTSGQRWPTEQSDGGFNPAPRPRGTRDELKYRGGDSKPVEGFDSADTVKPSANEQPTRDDRQPQAPEAAPTR